jgi:hypothetical protein
MALVIRKRVGLGFLGEEYKDSFMIFRSVSVEEYETKFDSMTVKDVVLEHFIEGEIQQDGAKVSLTQDNLLELPGEVFVECFEHITGKLNPKSPAL